MDNRILVITYYFAPKNEIASIRLTKIVKYLVKLGWDVTVLTFNDDPNNVLEKIQDKTLLSKELEQVRVIRIKQPRFLLIVYKIVKSVYQKISRIFSKENNNLASRSEEEKKLNKMSAFSKLKLGIGFLFDLCKNYLMFRKAVPYIKEILKNNQPNIIFSSYGPMVALNLGIYSKRKSPSSLLVLDFRDLIIRLGDFDIDVIRKYKSKIEMQALEIADLISVVSEGQKKDLLERNSKLVVEGKVHVITNGFDRSDLKYVNEDFIKTRESNVLHLCYTGRLYPGKSKLNMLVDVLNEIMYESPNTIKKIRVHYAGPSFNYFISQVRSDVLKEIIVNHGVITRNQALSLQRRSDILLMLSWNEENERGILTGKLYEYMMSGKPIIALISGNCKGSELKKIIETCNIGIALEEASEYEYEKARLKEYIYSSVNQIQENGKLRYEPKQNIIEQYDYKYITKKLDDLFKSNKFLNFKDN
ncbi:hypothetical protein P4499_06785 [Geobacillus kaustophilus]|uniref:hypothetical protein n=1 Tax=Geobacillus kaustophilus TaxID=1462 RepID=UPI002E1D3210|nr:hypothetical protein [Geobacillus kaustophilus]